jgi:hypothetical protein
MTEEAPTKRRYPGKRRAGCRKSVAPKWRVGLLLLLLTPGCASLPLFGLTTANVERANAKNPAVEILALWQASEGPGPNGVPMRGFAGQIYFFTQSRQAPVLVDGKVRIYLFDDHGSVKDQARPIGEYDCDSARWNARAHNSTLGPGYEVFIPYPRNDFHQSTCSLRIRFTPTLGPAIYSPPASVVLTGPPAKPAHDDERIVQQPQPVTKYRQQQQQNGNGATLTTSVTLPSPRPPFSQSVRPVSGTDADARMSLGDDIAAPNDNVVRTAEYTTDAAAQRSGRLRLQSAPSDSSAGEDD